MYVWKIPDLPSKSEKMVTVDTAKLILSGHRSIVNQVRFNPATHMIISAGVEKIIKVGDVTMDDDLQYFSISLHAFVLQTFFKYVVTTF